MPTAVVTAFQRGDAETQRLAEWEADRWAVLPTSGLTPSYAAPLASTAAGAENAEQPGGPWAPSSRRPAAEWAASDHQGSRAPAHSLRSAEDEAVTVDGAGLGT